MQSFKYHWFFPLVLLVLTACAPKVETENSDSPAAKQPIPDTPSDEAAQEPDPAAPPESTPDNPPIHVRDGGAQADSAARDLSTPDWEARYQELIARYHRTFVPPENGQRVTIELNSGRTKQGTLVERTETDLTLEIPNGRIQYPRSALTLRSSRRFFADVYAATTARQHALREYRQWMSEQSPASRPPAVNGDRRDQPESPATLSSQPLTAGEERMFPIPPHLLGK